MPKTLDQTIVADCDEARHREEEGRRAARARPARRRCVRLRRQGRASALRERERSHGQVDDAGGDAVREMPSQGSAKPQR
jgi:hypothetical protein